MKSHIISVHTGKKPHECTHGGKRFAQKGNLTSHITSVHTGEKPHECTQCGKRFALKGTLSSHIASLHTGEKPHECTHCGQKFALKGNLRRHITSVHTGGKAHERSQCGQRFTQRKGTLRKELWTVHITSVHMGEKPHKYSVWQSICNGSVKTCSVKNSQISPKLAHPIETQASDSGSNYCWSSQLLRMWCVCMDKSEYINNINCLPIYVCLQIQL